MRDIFKLPIETIDNVQVLEDNILSDLELENTDTNNSMYNYLFNTTNEYGKKMIGRWNKVYTSNKDYLKDTSNMIKNYDNKTTSNVCESWDKIKNTSRFLEKYYYIEWEYLTFLNDYSVIHTVLSYYRLISPFMTFLLPIILFLSSYFILRWNGLEMSFSDFYKMTMKVFWSNSIIGRFITGFSNMDLKTQAYSVFSIIMYISQIYNNIMVIVRMNSNLREMHSYIFEIKSYMKNTVESMKKYIELIKDYSTYNSFKCILKDNCLKMENFIDKINDIPKNHNTLNEIVYVGYVQKIIYSIYVDKELDDIMNYSFGFNGYIDNLNGVKQNIELKYISYAEFNNKDTQFKDAYYPPLLASSEKDKIVKNTYNLDKEIMISGPNAAGKTTLIKTTLFNIICSQQLGVGFYKKANIHIYDKLFCYLNIPDTSGRDSLFQAEARRCVDIINRLNSCNNNIRTFCIFDELYSGTNHYEAIASAYSFLNYLIKNYNFHFMMTTHFIDLCKKLSKNNKKIKNMKMFVKKHNDDFKYTYKVKKGISLIKGGVKVLKDLSYPEEIINDTREFLEKEF